ncbi:DNA recombination protein RmuC [Pseudomarimonas salicorniae]|uniref:DNA recombination protein RmuC n=1 Tax=Pseudomarimonas salicorniae TaxID=2933270 RepID=A0ABT0GLJ1_9GAMM|nr:DNA recombination protein RmuC [Lysobacter sp. CAU 1642]MCK7595415.1 DNA recombination protein RmuC [Lysobacter sp. CAU 1642]
MAIDIQLLWWTAGGLIAGLLIGALFLRGRAAAEYRRGQLEKEPELERLRGRVEVLQDELSREQQMAQRNEAQMSALREELDEVSERYAADRARLEQIPPLREALDAAQQQLTQSRAEMASLQARHAEGEARAQTWLQANEEKLALLAAAEQRLRDSFQSLAQQLLDERSKRFGEQSQKEIGGIVEPLREQLKQFREALAATHAAEARERGALSQEIQSLKQLNQKISEDAINLTRALRGDSQAQGAWGELVLERILQASGLRAGSEYLVQTSFSDEDGGRSRPDVIVRLPEERDLVIDSKVSLVAYERHVVAEGDAAREQALREHVASLKRHVDQLSGRNYAELGELRTLDFVLMFVPVEAAFVEAIRRDEGLYVYALERNVALVSPSTLLATLRTVAHLWKIERRNLNAQEIAQRAGRLYDYFVSLVEEIETIGQQLDKAQKAQAKALRRLTEGGKGSIVLQVQTLADLGAQSRKQLPDALVRQAGSDEPGDPGED